MVDKINRNLLSIFCGEAGTQQTSAFGTMKTDTPVYSRDPNILQTTDWRQGWGNATASDDAPFLEDFNTAFYVHSSFIKYLYQQGIAEWSESEQYFAPSSVCMLNGALYIALIDNIGSAPEESPEAWKKLIDANDAFVTESLFLSQLEAGLATRANVSLNNLDSSGLAVLAQKLNIDVDNISTLGLQNIKTSINQRVWFSDEQDIVAGFTSLTHNLALTPEQIKNAKAEVFLVCKVAELGYQVGDIMGEIGWTSQSSNDGSYPSPAIIRENNFLFSILSNFARIRVRNYTSNTATFTYLTNASWKWYVKLTY